MNKGLRGTRRKKVNKTDIEPFCVLKNKYFFDFKGTRNIRLLQYKTASN